MEIKGIATVNYSITVIMKSISENSGNFNLYIEENGGSL